MCISRTNRAESFHTLILRLGERAGMPFPIHPHMLRHGCGYALANAGHDTRAIQAWMGHTAHGAVHRACAGSLQELLARLTASTMQSSAYGR
jgi:integrase